jgi:hypothetical protein
VLTFGLRDRNLFNFFFRIFAFHINILILICIDVRQRLGMHLLFFGFVKLLEFEGLLGHFDFAVESHKSW